MSVTVQFLVLVLSFPAAGLLLYFLTVVEMRLLGDPADRKRRERARHAGGRTAPGQQALILSLARRQRRRSAPSPVAEDPEGEPNQRSPAQPGRLARSAHG
jgi:hypothetical protein